jgi:hypothetical protein
VADIRAGGDSISDADVDLADGGQVAIGKYNRQNIVYSDTASWREFVRRDIAQIHSELQELRGRIMFALILLFLLLIVGAMATGLMIRQFDHATNRIDFNTRRLDAIERREFRQYEIPPGGVP